MLCKHIEEKALAKVPFIWSPSHMTLVAMSMLYLHTHEKSQILLV